MYGPEGMGPPFLTMNIQHISHSLLSALGFTAQLSSPLFRYGLPWPIGEDVIPIRTSAHFILFDSRRVGPRYTMHQVVPGSELKEVDRDDDFIPESTLPESLQTHRKHYAAWNKANPFNSMDMGHQTPSAARRSDRLVQHDVDSLSGVCPESPELNRNVKRFLEAEIMERANSSIDVRCIQGPAWNGEDHEELESGQWVPDTLWTTALFRTNSQFEAFAWTMNNVQGKGDVKRSQISVNELSELVGLNFWSGIQSEKFIKSKDKIKTW